MAVNVTVVDNFASPVASNATADEWFISRLAGALIDAVWEQSENSKRAESPLNRFGGITRYCCSIYGITCLVMALILNRTLVIASTNNTRIQQRMHRNGPNITSDKLSELFKKISVLCFRLAIIVLLIYQGFNVLVALNLRGHIGIGETETPAWFYKYISDSLFAYDSEKYQNNKYMSTPADQVMLGPTTDMYWPIFLSFCFSSFMETFISVIQGRSPYTESGITIFEHSLAFQEFSGSFFFASSKIHQRPNEQLLVATLFLICNHLNIHVGALLNNNSYRLIPSSIFGLGFLTYFISSMFNNKFFGFPSILIITFIPQVLILQILALTIAIFLLTIVANGFKLQDLNYASFLKHENPENEIEFTMHNLNIHLKDDFYTALLNLVMISITSAGKSSYITELSIVNMDDKTWIERTLWQKIEGYLGPGADQHSKDNLIRYFKENNITGYGNIINTPSKRLITDKATADDKNYSSEHKSIFVKRFVYLRIIFVNIIQLVIGIIFRLAYKLFQIVLRKESQNLLPETEEEFNNRKRYVPSFLHRYMEMRREKRENMHTKQPKKTINLDEYSLQEIEDDYIELLAGQDILENDNSADYEVINESEYESDLDIEEVSPINELITGTSFMDMITTSSTNKYLQIHMNNETRLTRSSYQALLMQQTQEQDQSNKLIQLLIDKQLQPTKRPNEISIDCVICQVNTREIITWPCKCFAICEPCRLSLVAKGIEGCVCCRREVQGVSKVYIP